VVDAYNVIKHCTELQGIDKKRKKRFFVAHSPKNRVHLQHRNNAVHTTQGDEMLKAKFCAKTGKIIFVEAK